MEPRDRVYIFMRMVHDMKEAGLMIYKRGRGLRHGLMERFITGNLKMEKNMGRESLIEMMARNMKGVSLIITSMEKGPMYGTINGCLKEIGKITKCMAKEPFPGKMDGAMLESTSMTRSTVKDRFIGMTEEITQGNGRTENSMEKALT
jgi:hypothetical protein